MVNMMCKGSKDADCCEPADESVDFMARSRNGPWHGSTFVMTYEHSSHQLDPEV